MKFLNTASIVALAGLSPLMPTVYGAEMYDCGNGARFTTASIMEYTSLATAGGKSTSDPTFSGEHIKGAFRFKRVINNG
ncbi:putative secreted effector protein [Blumeria graminis f. sp. tritici 96224]|nr:putative secreted effector protein [Blumeria graminis f. sp. tritici 96224]